MNEVRPVLRQLSEFVMQARSTPARIQMSLFVLHVARMSEF